MLPGSEVQSLAVKQRQREPEEREPALSRASPQTAEERRWRSALPAGDSTQEDTLQQCRQQVASRWFALREAFGPEPAQGWLDRGLSDEVASICGIFSLAGGVGKTSLTAALGRALAATGERVVLAEVNAHGLLPFYFGDSARLGSASKRPDRVPTSDGQPAVISFSSEGTDAGAGETVFAEAMDRCSDAGQRVIVDLCSSAAWGVRVLLQRRAMILVPIAPDMTSVLTLRAVEDYLQGLSEQLRLPVQVRYVLSQFEPGLALHLDVRQTLERHLGDRLLPFTVRRSPAVAEALAEAMTVMDYAPESGVAGDYQVLADWIFAVPQVHPLGRRKVRWTQP